MDEISIELEQLEAYFSSKYVIIGGGRHRKTYDVGNGYVAKVPTCEAGLHDNWHEAFVFKRDKDWPYARCRMCGQYVLVMEKLDIDVGSRNNLPRWTDWVDCAQVGYDSKRRLKIYDYGIN
jgi:hypothetical protein